MRSVRLSSLDAGEVEQLLRGRKLGRLARRLAAQKYNGAMLEDCAWSVFEEASDAKTADIALATIAQLSRLGVPPEEIRAAPDARRRSGRRELPRVNVESVRSGPAVRSRHAAKSGSVPLSSSDGDGDLRGRKTIPARLVASLRGCCAFMVLCTVAIFTLESVDPQQVEMMGVQQLKAGSTWVNSRIDAFGGRLSSPVSDADADGSASDPDDDPYEFLNDDQFLALRRVRHRKPRVNYVAISDCCGVRYAKDIDGGVFLIITFFDQDRRAGLFVEEADALAHYRHLVALVGETPICTAASKRFALLQKSRGSSLLLVGFLPGNDGELVATFEATREGKRRAGHSYDCASRAAALKRTSLASVGCPLRLKPTPLAKKEEERGGSAANRSAAANTTKGARAARERQQRPSAPHRDSFQSASPADPSLGERSATLRGSETGRRGRALPIRSAGDEEEAAFDVNEEEGEEEEEDGGSASTYVEDDDSESTVAVELINALEQNYAALRRPPLVWRHFSQSAMLQLLRQSYREVALAEAAAESVAAVAGAPGVKTMPAASRLKKREKRGGVRSKGGMATLFIDEHLHLDAPLPPLSASVQPSTMSFGNLERPDELSDW